MLLLDGVPVLGIVAEVQLSPDERKSYVWPAYVTNLRARLAIPVALLVVAADDAVARWAARPIAIGGGNRFTPLVLHPAGVPVVTDEAEARADPELAVLSAIAHGRDADAGTAVQRAAVELACDGQRMRITPSAGALRANTSAPRSLSLVTSIRESASAA